MTPDGTHTFWGDGRAGAAGGERRKAHSAASAEDLEPVRASHAGFAWLMSTHQMSVVSILEAQDLIAFADLALRRLSVACARVHGAHDEPLAERSWLATAAERVSAGLERTRGALAEACELPEFSGNRKLKSEALSNALADAVEAVFDAIVANVSGNGPLIEALFQHQRFDVLRRPGAAAKNFWVDFERRSESGYVRRLCGDPCYEFLPPLLEAAKTAERQLREAVAPRALPTAKEAKLREHVSSAAMTLEVALRQARALCEAVFAAEPGVLAELGLDAKPKRRALRTEPAKLSAS